MSQSESLKPDTFALATQWMVENCPSSGEFQNLQKAYLAGFAAAWNRRPSTADRGGEVEPSEAEIAAAAKAYRESEWGTTFGESIRAMLTAATRIRSALATTAGEGWLDIESAPKDGSRLWLVNQQMQEPVIGQWDDYRTPTGKVIKEWIVTHDPHERFQPLRYGTLITPTHWQPLPAALVTDKG